MPANNSRTLAYASQQQQNTSLCQPTTAEHYLTPANNGRTLANASQQRQNTTLQ
jgi:hypothetical protein